MCQFSTVGQKQRGNDSQNLSIQWTLINIHERCNHKQFPALDITFKPRAFLYQFDCSTSQYKHGDSEPNPHGSRKLIASRQQIATRQNHLSTTKHQNETTDLVCVEACNRDTAVSLSSHSSKTTGLPLTGFLQIRQMIYYNLYKIRLKDVPPIRQLPNHCSFFEEVVLGGDRKLDRSKSCFPCRKKRVWIGFRQFTPMANKQFNNTGRDYKAREK